MTEQEFDMLITQAMKQYVENSVDDIETFMNTEPEVEFSDRFKKRINRLFREQVGSKSAMYPEVDSRYERVRSRIIRTELIAAEKVKKVFKRGNPT